MHPLQRPLSAVVVAKTISLRYPISRTGGSALVSNQLASRVVGIFRVCRRLAENVTGDISRFAPPISLDDTYKAVVRLSANIFVVPTTGCALIDYLDLILIYLFLFVMLILCDPILFLFSIRLRNKNVKTLIVGHKLVSKYSKYFRYTYFV